MKLFKILLLAILCIHGVLINIEAIAQNTKQVFPEENTFDVVVRHVSGDHTGLEVKWYPPDNLNEFIIEYKNLTSGEIHTLIVSGDNFARIEGIETSNKYSVSVKAINDMDEIVGYSPEEIWHGKRAPMLAALNPQTKPAQPEIATTLEATLKSLDSNKFPFIYTSVAVDTGVKPVAGLTTTDFTAFEDGRLQTDFFHVTPPDTGGNVRILDFIFVIDNSGSMGEEHQQVKDNVKAFVDSLAVRQIDVRLGLVRFGQSEYGGQPIIMNNGNMTGDVIFFKTLLDQMTAQGGVEPGIKAIYQAATTFSFRPGSQRHFLLITDEDSDGGNLAQTRNTCNNNGLTVHAAVDTTYGSTKTDYSGPNSIRDATGGLLFDVIGPYNDILEKLKIIIGNTYIVRYRSFIPICDGQQREVRILVSAFNQSDDVIGSYLPCAAPIIQRTQATIDLSKFAKVAGSALTIAAEITDTVAPFVQGASLYYRQTGSSTYVSIPMPYAGNDIYEVMIPGSAVITPGVDYYITATDGQVTSSEPTVDPDSFPYQIAVLPNQPPQITHTPVTIGFPGQDILISAGVVDNTNFLNTVDLHYRKFGTLLYENVSMSSVGGNQYEGTIPGGILTNAGVEYFIRAVDNFELAAVHGVHTIISDTSGCVSTFSNNFEDGNADDWHPKEPSRWNVGSIESSLAYCLSVPNPNGDEYSLLLINWNNFELEIDAKSTSADGRGFFILFGVNSLTNSTGTCYYLRFSDGGVDLFRSLVPGEGAIIASAPDDFVSDNNYHHVKIERQFPNIKVKVDGQSIVDVNDETFAKGFFGFGAWKTTACFDNVAISTQDCQDNTATTTIPGGLEVAAGHSLDVPIFVSTQEFIGLAQFTIEYDKNDIQFDSTTIGPDALGFSISQQSLNPPFATTTPGTNQNLTVQISGGGTNYFTGNDKTVLVLNFTAVGSVGETSPLAIDSDCSHTFLTTKDLDDICDNRLTFNNGDVTITTAAEINGHMLYFSESRPVKNSTLTLTGAVQTTQVTDDYGFYRFSDIAPGNYTLVPSKNDDQRSAIKGSDALLLMRYLAYLDTLSSEQMLTADVTQNGTINGSDVVGILRYLVFYTTNIGTTGNWHFVPQSVSLNVSTVITQDFKSFLIGDVIGDWGAIASTNQLAKFNTNEGVLILDQVSATGSELVHLSVSIHSNQNPIHTIVYSIAYDTSKVLLRTVERKNILKDYLIEVNDKKPGSLHIAAVGVQPVSADQAIFDLTFEINKKQIDKNQGYFIPITFSRAVLNDHLVQGIDGGIEVSSNASTSIPTDFELMQNYPNPFNLETTFRFGIPNSQTESSHIILEIYNVNGQRVRRLLDVDKSPGYYSIQWDGRDDQDRVVSTGIYFYTLKSETIRLSKKLLLIK